MTKVPFDIKKIVSEFDTYSDDQIIPDRPAADILGIHYTTLRRNNPVPAIRLSAGRTGRRVGDIRDLVRGAREAAE